MSIKLFIEERAFPKTTNRYCPECGAAPGERCKLTWTMHPGTEFEIPVGTLLGSIHIARSHAGS